MPRFVGTGNNSLLNSGSTLDPALLPRATTSTYGVIKVGSGLAVNNGILSADAAGTVTSVALSVPSILSVAGSPVTTSGTLEVTLAVQNSNLVFAGPTSGATPAAPTFRNLVAADIPNIDAAKIASGTLDAARIPVATMSTVGGIKVGGGLSITAGVLSADLDLNNTTTTVAPNRVLAGPNSGNIDATPSFRALVGADLPVATASSLGAIKVGTGLSISNGILNADIDLNNTTTSVAANRILAGPTTGANAIPGFRALVGADLPVATASSLGAIKVGTGLSISNGVLSADVDLNATTTSVAANKILAGPTSGVNTTPSFRSLVGTDLPIATASALGAIKVGSGLSISNGVLSADGMFFSYISYLDFAVPSTIFNLSGSPVTAQPGGGPGSISITLKSQSPNLVWASPNSTSGTPTFRSLLAADIPNLAASKITSGQLAIAQGGTGLSAAGTANQILGVQDPNTGGLEYKTLTAGSGITINHSAGAVTISSSSSGGTVTSVGMTVPTGLSVTPASITTSGTFDVTLASGYSIPTTTSQSNWDTAYSDRMKWDGGSSGLTASTGRASLGATTVGANIFTLANPAAVSFLRVNADNTVDALSAASFRAAIGATTGENAVTAVSAAAPLSSSGGTTPEISLGTVGTDKGGTGLTTTPTNGQLLIGNGSGFSLAALTAGDNITITNTAGGIKIDASAGSNNTSMTNPMTALGDVIYGGAAGIATKLVGETTSTRKFLRSVGSSGLATAPAWDTVTASDVGLGNVENTALSSWAGSANITTLGSIASGTWGGTTIAVNKGGTGQTSYTDGQLLIGNSTGNTLSKATLTAGSNIAITNGAGSITITATGVMANPMTSSGDIIYGGVSGAPTKLSGETTTTRKFLRSVGDGMATTVPAWDTLVAADIPALSYLPLAGGTMSGGINMGVNNITNGGFANFKGLRSYSSGGGGAATTGYYAPIVIASITAQYAWVSLTLSVSNDGGSGDASEIESAIVRLRFKQQNAMAGASIVDLEVLSATSDNWSTDSFIFIQTSNTAGLSEGTLYVEMKHNYSGMTATILDYAVSSNASYVTCSASTSPTNALVAAASLPAGTQTKAGSFYNSGSNILRMFAGSAERMRIASNGNVTVNTSTFAVDAVNGRVGVGTASPSYKLDVNFGAIVGTVTSAVTNTDTAATSDTRQVLANSATNGGLILRSTGHATEASDLILYSTANNLRFYTGGSLRATIDTSGNLGVGVAAAANYRIDTLASAAADAYARFKNSNSAYSSILEIASNSAIGRLRAVGSTSTGTTALDTASVVALEGTNVAGVNIVASSATGSVKIYAGGTADPTNRVATFTSGGRLGVGNTGPSYALDVQNDVASGDVGIRFRNTDNTSTGRSIFFLQAGTYSTALYAYSGSYVSTGAQRPNAGMVYNGGTGGLSIATAASGPLTFYTNGDLATTKMILTTGGLLGLGGRYAHTDTPPYSISLANGGARSIGVDRVGATGSGTPGNNLTIRAGGAEVSSTDVAGGNLILQSGISTGAGANSIILQTNTAASGTTDGTYTTRMTINQKGSVILGSAALATSATDGFLYIATCAGAPTGVPTASTGRVAMVYDTTNNQFYIYNGAWKKVALA